MKDQSNYWVLGHKISPVEVSGNYDMVIGGTTPNIPVPPSHFHSEMNKLLHTFKNAGEVPCKWINIYSPKGFLSFFKDMGVAEGEAEAFQKSIDEKVINRVMQEAADYDMYIRI
jgi:hypothetical protein